ncbi:MAG TPA: lysophospholipid acyltransferase family protein [Myxococcaceae bacterium]|nr:lysophospholipid acyltransferase family protein [Myxococcaceae bacterium]
MRALLYDALVAFLKLVTRVFFRTIEVVGTEHIPQDGPVVFVGNHPNSLIDPVLIITTCGRRVRFAAKDTLFKSVALRPILWMLGAVPIKRRQDHDGSDPKVEEKETSTASPPVDNASAFEALFAVLKEQGAFGIFPEGISHSRAELAPMKTGAARIALGAAKQGIPVRVVPSGLSYRRRERLRGRVLVQFGPPLLIDDARLDAEQKDPRAAAQALTADIEASLRALTINARDFDTLRMLDGVRRLYQPKDKKLSLSEQGELMRRFVEHYERLKDVPEVDAFCRDVEAYQDRVRSLGLRDRDLLRPVTFASRTWHLLRHLFFMLVLAPLALPGIPLHLPALMAAVWAGDNLTQRKDVVATVKMLSITALVLLGYAGTSLYVLRHYPPPDGLALAGLVLGGLLLSGWATIRVLERQAVLRRGFTVLLALLNLEAELAKLRVTRDELRSRLLGLVDRYMDKSLTRIIEDEDHAVAS